jgi:hypothetical protein
MNGTNYKVHLDGYNNLDYWTGTTEKSGRREYFYYDETDLMAVRVDGWKMAIGVKPEGLWWDISFSACTSTMKFVWPFGILPAQRWRWSALSHEVELNWTGLLWLAVLPAIARSLAGESAASQVPTFNGAWRATIVIPLLIYGAVFHYMALRVPDIGNPSLKMLPIAWEELGEQVEKIETDLQRATGEARLRTELPRTLVPHPCLRQVSLHCPLNGEVHDFIKGCP